MMLLLLLILLNYQIITAQPVPNDNASWWNSITNHIPFWYPHEELPEDNETEIENSLKLKELFVPLKEQLESSNPIEQEEAKEFMEKMKDKINEKKRYTNMIWKGIHYAVDMGKVGSHERKGNQEEVGLLMRLINGLFNMLKCIFTLGNDCGTKPSHATKSVNESGKHHQDSGHIGPIPTTHQPPPSDPNAGNKNKMDSYENKVAEFLPPHSGEQQ